MEQNSQTDYRYRLESQIREAYGRVTYTQTCHDKIIARLHKNNEFVKVLQIILSALTTGTFIITIIGDGQTAKVIGALLSLSLLIVNSFAKNFNFIETAQEHQKAADMLWIIREEYVSLLTDFCILSEDEIIKKRDALQKRTAEIYSSTKRTDKKSYSEAQQALKFNEEQTFSDEELDIMLPAVLRRCNVPKDNNK